MEQSEAKLFITDKVKTLFGLDLTDSGFTYLESIGVVNFIMTEYVFFSRNQSHMKVGISQWNGIVKERILSIHPDIENQIKENN